MPSHKSTEDAVRQLKENCQEHIDIRYIEKMSDTKATILVVDRKASLVMEIRNDSKQTFEEAIGLSITRKVHSIFSGYQLTGGMVNCLMLLEVGPFLLSNYQLRHWDRAKAEGFTPPFQFLVCGYFDE